MVVVIQNITWDHALAIALIVEHESLKVFKNP